MKIKTYTKQSSNTNSPKTILFTQNLKTQPNKQNPHHLHKPFSKFKEKKTNNKLSFGASSKQDAWLWEKEIFL